MLRNLSLRALLAARWALDVIRGYQRLADGREGLAEMHTRSPWAASVDAETDALRLFAEARMMPGGFGFGARLAITSPEMAAIQVRIDQRHAAVNGTRVEA
jgi:hypothetical protein